jgi:hypothetical protein
MQHYDAHRCGKAVMLADAIIIAMIDNQWLRWTTALSTNRLGHLILPRGISRRHWLDTCRHVTAYYSVSRTGCSKLSALHCVGLCSQSNSEGARVKETLGQYLEHRNLPALTDYQRCR